MTSWLDRLATTPGLGLRLEPRARPSESLLTALGPVLDKQFIGDRQGFAMEAQDSFSVQFITDDGFFYGVDPHRVWVEFRHRIRAKVQSAAPPTTEVLSKPSPFSQLMPAIAGRVVEATKLLNEKPGGRKLDRIGVIANTVVREDEAPPGFVQFIKHVSQPWSAVDEYDIRVVGEVAHTAERRDRCVHRIQRLEGGEGLVSIMLDWQRSYTDGRTLDVGGLPGLLDRAQKDAIEYFEELAGGGRFDGNGDS